MKQQKDLEHLSRTDEENENVATILMGGVQIEGMNEGMSEEEKSIVKELAVKYDALKDKLLIEVRVGYLL